VSAPPTTAPPKTALLDAYPELTPFRDAARAADWPALAEQFAALTDADARVIAGVVVDESVPDGFLEGVVAEQRTAGRLADVLALALFGQRLVTLGWKVRSGAQAQFVHAQQFQRFHEILRESERALIEACAREPGEPLAWITRLSTARGLELGVAEARRRYDRLNRVAPGNYRAQSRMVQQLSPKWSGSYEAMHGFAQECLQAAPPGTITGALVAEAHIEHWLRLNWNANGPGDIYIATPAVQQDIAAAAARSVRHPDYRPTYDWVLAQASFAMAFSLAGNYAAAAPHFRALGPLGSRHPWDYLNEAAFSTHRARALAEG
jgi:hypothetical protein